MASAVESHLLEGFAVMAVADTRIIPVILSGGAGTRLWPMSTPACPKQFLALHGELTMFQQTLSRIADPLHFAAPMIVANASHASLIESQMAAIAMLPSALMLEPCARNTAPAIALAALEAGDSPMLVMPSDHVITDPDAFHAAIARALPLARAGWLVTFGITPDAPETGYGYLATGEILAEGVNRVARFVEKPAREAAEAMLAAGDHYWNGGIFLFCGSAYRAALAQHAPAMLIAAERALGLAERRGRSILPDADAFAAAPADSIDFAVMEKADRVAMVPVAMGWSDVGSWDALYDIAAKDSAGNAVQGDVIVLDSSDNLIRSDGLRITTVGVSDLIIVASGSDVLILPRGQAQAVRAAVAARQR